MTSITSGARDLPGPDRISLASRPMPSSLRTGATRPSAAPAVRTTVLMTVLAVVLALFAVGVPASASPAGEPTPTEPTADPTSVESDGSEPVPSEEPTVEPTQDPTQDPSVEPTQEPSAEQAEEQAGKASGAKGAKKKPKKFWMHLATYNVLGSQHTRGRGGYGPGVKRARMTATEFKRRGLDIIGMQEVQRDQYHVFRNRLPKHRIWPGTSLGNQGIRLQIAWRKSEFKLMKKGTIMTRFHRQTRPVPWVKLKSRKSGRRIYVVNIHNSPNSLEHERDSATKKEIALIKRLRSRGNPVFVTGDMNEKKEFYCKVTARTDLSAANGGRTSAPRCSPPKRRLRVDWIMGGKRVHFSRYREDRGGNLRRTSDHRLIHTKVKVGPRPRR